MATMLSRKEDLGIEEVLTGAREVVIGVELTIGGPFPANNIIA